MAKVLTVLGTRPEAIKLAPVLRALFRLRGEIDSKVCVTGQHRETLSPFLELFHVALDWNLDVMRPDQSLFDVTTAVLTGVRVVLERERPDLVLVQGDTTTALAAALAAYYCKIPLGHVEAGLRSHRKDYPFPEEMNRTLVDALADLYFAPTEHAKRNLLRESVDEARIWVTGNTVVDALIAVTQGARFRRTHLPIELKGGRLILVTAHRRESFGSDLANICRALRKIAAQHPEVEIVYPVHLNPNVRGPVHELLRGADRVHLLKPLGYLPFVKLMSQAYLILTDSGGIQEEGPTLGVPVLVMRETTERPEVLEAGAAKLVGTDPDAIFQETARLLRDAVARRKMAQAPNPYGDGRAAKRIVAAVRAFLERSAPT